MSQTQRLESPAAREMHRAFTQTLLPRGETTAYHVLRHVARLIEEEPVRLDMRTFLTVIEGRDVNLDYDQVVPACGTVACASGWIGVATRMTTATTFQWSGCYPTTSAVFRRLGLTPHGVQGATQNQTLVRDELYRLFYRVYATPAEVVDSLRDIARRYRPTLLRRKVVIE